MQKQFYCQSLLNGIIITGQKSETKAIITSNGNLVLKSKAKKDYERNNIFSNIPLIRGIIILISYLISFIKSLNDSSEFIERELNKKNNNKKISKKLDLYFIDILTFMSIIFSLCIAFIILIILPSLLVYLLNLIIVTSPINFLLEGILRIIIFYLLLTCFSKISKIKTMYMFHGAFHKISQCYENKKELTLENIKKYKCCDSKCGLSFIFSILFISVILFSIIQINAPGMLNTLNRIIYMLMISGVFYEIKLLTNNKICFIGNIFQKTLVMEPTDEILLMVKEAFEINIKKGEEYEEKNN